MAIFKVVISILLVASVVIAQPCEARVIRSAASQIKIISPSATGSWAARISGPSVVWYHNFDSAAEVNQFRWTSGYNGGQDPLAKGVGGNLLFWQSSGGVDGGSYMRLNYPAGNDPGRGSSYWWRPFNPLTGATNGRGVDDPGANGSIARAAFNVSDGSGTMGDWGKSSNPGWYGHPIDQAKNPTKYQGHDYYLQVRVRRSSTPGAPPNTPSYSNITGKLVWLTTSNSSYSAQELVTYGQSAGNEDVVGVQSRMSIYDGQNYGPLGVNYQPNETTTISNWNLNWRYSGGWDTLLYHVTPGTPGGTGNERTRVEAWAQHDLNLFPAESGRYTKIYDTLFSQSYDGGSNSVGSPGLPGWNALILAIYHNGSNFSTSFNFDYDQVIFSKAMIEAPTN